MRLLVCLCSFSPALSKCEGVGTTAFKVFTDVFCVVAYMP